MKKLFAGIITCVTILLTGIGVSAVAADENNSGNENVQSEIVFCIVNSEQTGRTAYSYGGFFIESNGNVRTFSFDNIEENFTFNAYWDAFYNAPQSVMLNESFPHDKLLSHLNDNISEYKIVENISTEEYASKASLLSEIKVDAEIPFVPFEIAGMTSYTESFGVRYDNDDNAQIVFMNGHVSGDMKYRTYLENPDEKSIELNNWLIEKYKSFMSSEPITTTAPTTASAYETTTVEMNQTTAGTDETTTETNSTTTTTATSFVATDENKTTASIENITTTTTTATSFVATDENKTTASIENITATTETTTTATNHIASDEEFCNWAAKDYEGKTGVMPANAEIEYIAEGTAVITLTDVEGNVLDIYTIDPTTGIGKASDGGTVDLPQTGYSNTYKVIIGFAILLTIGGTVIVAKSRRQRTSHS